MTKFKFGDKVRVLSQTVKPYNWLGAMMDYQDKEGVIVKESLTNYYVVFEDGFTWIYKEHQLELINDKDTHKVEREKTYKVRMVGLYKDEQVLHHSFEEDVWYFKSDFNDGLRHQRDSRYHTKNELEEAGFGDVFNNPMLSSVISMRIKNCWRRDK